MVLDNKPEVKEEDQDRDLDQEKTEHIKKIAVVERIEIRMEHVVVQKDQQKKEDLELGVDQEEDQDRDLEEPEGK